MKRDWIGPAVVGLVWGLLVGVTPSFQPISGEAKVALGLGLGLTYLSIGVLVGLLPMPGREWWARILFGAVVGILYSIPGAIFTMTPYPLAEDAPEYFREFASGGWRAFALTLGFGAVVGLTSGLARHEKSAWEG
jgi:hypothetical protein